MPLQIMLTLEYGVGDEIVVVHNPQKSRFDVQRVQGRRVVDEFWKVFLATHPERADKPHTRTTIALGEVLDEAYVYFEEHPHVLTHGKSIRIYNNSQEKIQSWVWKSTIKSVSVTFV
jgi:hypothetical protein